MMTLKIAILAVMISSSVPPHSMDINKPIEYQQVPAIVNYITKVIPVKQAAPIRQTINEDKTYEQSMREAFERIYEEVNAMLDEVVDGRGEQF